MSGETQCSSSQFGSTADNGNLEDDLIFGAFNNVMSTDSTSISCDCKTSSSTEQDAQVKVFKLSVDVCSMKFLIHFSLTEMETIEGHCILICSIFNAKLLRACPETDAMLSTYTFKQRCNSCLLSDQRCRTSNIYSIDRSAVAFSFRPIRPNKSVLNSFDWLQVAVEPVRLNDCKYYQPTSIRNMIFVAPPGD